MRYFFNIAGAITDRDNQGVDISSLCEARVEAVKFAAQYLSEKPQLLWLGEELRVEVLDSDRRLLFTFIALGVDAPAENGRLRF